MSEGSIEYDRRFALESSMHTGRLRKKDIKLEQIPGYQRILGCYFFSPVQLIFLV